MSYRNPKEGAAEIVENWLYAYKQRRSEAVKDPNHPLWTAIRSHTIDAPVLYRGMAVPPDDPIMQARVGDVLDLPPSSFSEVEDVARYFMRWPDMIFEESVLGYTRNVGLSATETELARKLPCRVLLHLRGAFDGMSFLPIHGLSVNEHRQPRVSYMWRSADLGSEVVVAGTYVVRAVRDENAAERHVHIQEQ